jgi:hypothetical protein
MKLAMAWVAVAMAALGAACGDEARVCIPNQSLLCACAGGTTSVQSCNEAGTGFTPCQCGGAGQPDVTVTPDSGGADAGTDACDASDRFDHRECLGQDVFWFDGCGGKADFVETCAGGQACSGGKCVGAGCVPDVQKKCEGQSVYWFDSCGNRGDKVESCGAGEACADGACFGNCVPHASKKCSGNDVFWFDGCDAQESVAEACDDLQYCVNASCVKPVYNGKWYIESQTPNDPTFQATFFELVVDGTNVTLSEPDAPVPQTFTGTLSGHTIKVTGSSSGILGPTKTTIIANFFAPTDLKGQPPPITMDGSWLEEAAGFPLSWKIKGTRQ